MFLKNKKKPALICTACIAMFSTILAYGVTYSINTPQVTYTSSNTKVTMNVKGSMTSSPASYLRLSITPRYSLRGSVKPYIDDTAKYVNSYTSRVESLVGTVSYVNAVDSHKTYMEIYQQGQVGINSSGSSYTTVVTKRTGLN